MSLEQYIPDIEELVQSFENAGYAKEASDLKAVLAATAPYVPTRPRPVKAPQEVVPQDKNIEFAQPGEEITRLTPSGDVPTHQGLGSPVLDKNMTRQESIDLDEYFGKNELYGYGAVNRFRNKIEEEKAKAAKDPSHDSQISYYAKELEKARARVESLKKPVAEYEAMKESLGVNFSQLGPDDLSNIRPKDDKQRQILSRFLKLHNMLVNTSQGYLDAGQIDVAAQAAMNDAQAPELYKKQVEQLRHMWTKQAAASKLIEASILLEKFGLNTVAGRLKTAAMSLDKDA